MVFVLIAVVAVAVVVAVVVLGRRPSGTDLDSVRGYHSALGTLEQLADRSGPTASRLRPPPRVGSGTMPLRPGTEGEVPPVPVRGNDEFPDPEAPLVFDDARPRDRYLGSRAAEGAPAHRVDRAQRHALDSMNHRPRRGLTLVVVAVAVVAVFAVLAYTGSKRSPTTGRATGTTSSTTLDRGSHGSSSPTTTRPLHSTKPGHEAKPTPTTLPATLVAVSSTDTRASYSVPFASYQLTVTASAPSWVQVTTVATDSVLWAGTVQPGTQQVIHAVGEVSVEIGLPSVTMVVGTIPVQLPTVLHTPFVATFQPAAPTAPTTTTPTSTTPAPTTTSEPAASTTG